MPKKVLAKLFRSEFLGKVQTGDDPRNLKLEPTPHQCDRIAYSRPLCGAILERNTHHMK